MAAKMRISVIIEDENGSELVKTESSKEVPSLVDFDQLGFREGFHQLETAVLEARKESAETAVENYLEALSKKKRH